MELNLLAIKDTGLKLDLGIVWDWIGVSFGGMAKLGKFSLQFLPIKPNLASPSCRSIKTVWGILRSFSTSILPVFERPSGCFIEYLIETYHICQFRLLLLFLA